MKKIQKILLFFSALCLLFTSAAFAADTQRELSAGFFNIGSHENVSIEARLSDNTAAPIVTAAIDNSTVVYYEDAARFSVSYLGQADAGDHFTVILVTGSGLPTASNTICYIDQITKASEGIVFDVYPLLPASATGLTLYITSSRADFTTIAIPLSYAPAGTYQQAPYLSGDANGDLTVNINDVLSIINHIAGKAPLTGNALLAADVTEDGRVNINDATQILNYIVE